MVGAQKSMLGIVIAIILFVIGGVLTYKLAANDSNNQTFIQSGGLYTRTAFLYPPPIASRQQPYYRPGQYVKVFMKHFAKTAADCFASLLAL